MKSTNSDKRVVSLVGFICLTILTIKLADGQATINGPISYGTECCTQRIIDSLISQVAIETTRPLGPATYQAFRVRACTTDTIVIQVWRRVDTSNSYQFIWQQQWTPSPSQTSLTYVIIPLASALTTTQQDRLGFFSLSTVNQLSVPFDVNQTSTIYYSSTVISNPASVFNVGQQITLDTSLAWPRSFANYVSFCTAADCSDQPLSAVLSAASTPSSGQCCVVDPNLQLGCDPSPDTVSQLQQQSNYIQTLQQTMSALTGSVGSIMSQNLVSGLCPTGFISGAYGTGSCYLMFSVQLNHNEAVELCRENNAYLLTIDGSAEEKFIVNFVQNSTAFGGITKIWTSGMYYSGTWYWYPDPTSTASNQIIYTNWLNDVVPIPTNAFLDICLSMNINRAQNTDYWTKDRCSNRQAVVCELSKQCL